MPAFASMTNFYFVSRRGISTVRVVDGIMKPKSELDFEWVDRELACAVKVLEALLEMLERVAGAMSLSIAKT